MLLIIPNVVNERLDFFRTLRSFLSVEEDMINFDIAGIEAFRDSAHGKESILIEDTAWKEYRKSYDAIIDEHERLKDLYLSEFTITNSVKGISEILEELGYKFKYYDYIPIT